MFHFNTGIARVLLDVRAIRLSHQAKNGEDGFTVYDLP